MPEREGEALPELGARTSRDWTERLARSRGQGLPDLLRLRRGRVPRIPDAVVWPREGEVGGILERCARTGVTVVPRGGGSSVTGGLNLDPESGPSLVLDLEMLGGLVGLDRESGLATFGAGTLGPALEAALAPHGLELGHLPQSWELSSLGGWIVTRSSGQESFGVGRIEDLVAGMELVAPAGRLRLDPQPASAAGPDLRQMVLGSEGRLGVVTRATVRVRPAAEGRRVAAWLLPGWEAGRTAVRTLAVEEVPVDMIRLSDSPETEVAMRVGLGQGMRSELIRDYLALRGVESGCLLFVGIRDGDPGRRRGLDRARGIVRTSRGVGLGRSPGRTWLADRFRHPYLRDALLDRGVATDTLESGAPWARLDRIRGAVIRATHRAAEARNEQAAVLCHLSHAYRDGCSLYFTLFFRCSSDLDETLELWAGLKRAATDALVAAGGTLSHHHGVGAWHAPWLSREIGEEGVEIVRAAARPRDRLPE